MITEDTEMSGYTERDRHFQAIAKKLGTNWIALIEGTEKLTPKEITVLLGELQVQLDRKL